MADVYMEAQCGEEYAPPQELHRFLVHSRDGGRLESVAQKRSDGSFIQRRMPAYFFLANLLQQLHICQHRGSGNYC